MPKVQIAKNMSLFSFYAHIRHMSDMLNCKTYGYSNQSFESQICVDSDCHEKLHRFLGPG